MSPLTHPRLVEIAAYLDSVRGGLATVVTATAPEAMSRVRSPNRWTGAQIVQHLGKVEGSTTKLLEGVFAAALAEGLAAEESTTSLMASLDQFTQDGQVLRPLVAPERLRPLPDPDLAASWTSLGAVRERTYRAYASVDGRDLTRVTAPHPLFGPLNGYQWLLFLGKHEERHLTQMRRELSVVRRDSDGA